MSSTDPIAEPILALLAVFAELPEVRFGDLDHAALASLADEVAAHAASVEAARVALDEANEALTATRERLTKRAAQGLQYARVYADGDALLSERLASIRLSAPRAATKKATKKAVAKRAKPTIVKEPERASA